MYFWHKKKMFELLFFFNVLTLNGEVIKEGHKRVRTKKNGLKSEMIRQ